MSFRYTWDKVSTWFKNKFFLKPVKGPEEKECLLTLVTDHNGVEVVHSTVNVVFSCRQVHG